MFHQSMTPQVPGEPLEWRPYRCHYRWYTGEQLSRCVSELGRMKLIGESTLGQMYELMLAHMNASGFYWPYHIPVDDARGTYGMPDRIRAQGVHSEFHGLSVVAQHAKQELLDWPPDVIVQLQASVGPGAGGRALGSRFVCRSHLSRYPAMQVANDAARDTVAAYKQRMLSWIDELKGLIADGKIAPKRWIWVTAPVRHYKAGPGPGSAYCPQGNVASCVSVFHGKQFEDSTGEVTWIPGHFEPPMFFGTLDRRRALNALGLRMMRDAFPSTELVDFELISEALPSDYCIDGEHWGCPFRSWDNRHLEPYQCKPLGNIVISNIWANVLCNKLANNWHG